MLEAAGFYVCDADRVAHQLMEKGAPVYESVVSCFGADVLSEDGTISRAQLGAVVFADSEKRQQLNVLVHPAVKAAINSWIAEHRFAGSALAVQIPLLFESGMDSMAWDAVICVSSSEELVLKRLESRGLSAVEAKARIASQMPLKEKEERSDQIIYNLGTLQELEAATRSVVNRLMLER